MTELFVRREIYGSYERVGSLRERRGGRDYDARNR